jgi:hypothetical protein
MSEHNPIGTHLLLDSSDFRAGGFGWIIVW